MAIFDHVALFAPTVMFVPVFHAVAGAFCFSAWVLHIERCLTLASGFVPVLPIHTLVLYMALVFDRDAVATSVRENLVEGAGGEGRGRAVSFWSQAFAANFFKAVRAPQLKVGAGRVLYRFNSYIFLCMCYLFGICDGIYEWGAYFRYCYYFDDVAYYLFIFLL